MKEDKEIELDCSKNCKFVVQACEVEGRSRDECENRYHCFNTLVDLLTPALH